MNQLGKDARLSRCSTRAPTGNKLHPEDHSSLLSTDKSNTEIIIDFLQIIMKELPSVIH